MRHADGPHGNGLLRLVARTRTGAEGAPGIEWLLTAAPSEARDEAMSKAYRRWLNTDRESVIAWLLGAKANTALEPPAYGRQ